MAVRTATPTAQLVSNHNYRSAFEHANEESYPGYYAAYLDTHRVDAEMTVGSTHGGVHRYTYDPTGPRGLLLDVCHTVSDDAVCYDASVNVTVANGACPSRPRGGSARTAAECACFPPFSLAAALGTLEIRANVLQAGSLTRRNGRVRAFPPPASCTPAH